MKVAKTKVLEQPQQAARTRTREKNLPLKQCLGKHANEGRSFDVPVCQCYPSSSQSTDSSMRLASSTHAGLWISFMPAQQRALANTMASASVDALCSCTRSASPTAHQSAAVPADNLPFLTAASWRPQTHPPSGRPTRRRADSPNPPDQGGLPANFLMFGFVMIPPAALGRLG
eukprot:CAMPEP_0113683194 /NCGR_PEP_ID=MMETSP0038_2-20120614/13143_1 /TAXON_ID=2898 /ORGANISM="Cryptomonas paramecium" /LENGTH=172 /DNA_ID=CAMNT_0000602467 /DNA_START=724 /DNA_END=1238 /DNA_ORIENTATION=- /assembly_acc=CAM_ASM_000170